MTTPAFEGIHLFVRDMAASVRFYRALGLPIREGAENEVHAEAPLGNGANLAFGTLELTRGYDPGYRQASGGSPNSLQFAMPSREAVDEIYARLTAEGHTGHLAPIDGFWGSRYAVVDDPDGNIVGFHSPRDPGKGSRPPL